MAEQTSCEQRKALNIKKMELTLDEYYEQHVRSGAANLDSGESNQRSFYIIDTNVMELTLDEYYEKFVLPKAKLQVAKKEEDHRRSHYQRTHYFGPNYLKRLKRQPKQ